MSLGVLAIAAVVLVGLFALLVPITVGAYVYKDAKERDMNAALWTLICVFAPSFVGLIIYLIVRGQYSSKKCPQCGMAVRDTFAVCPGCGANLKEKCLNCNTPLEPGWAICPSCGIQIPEQQRSVLTEKKNKDKGLRMVLIILLVFAVLFVSVFGSIFITRMAIGYDYDITADDSMTVQVQIDDDVHTVYSVSVSVFENGNLMASENASNADYSSLAGQKVKLNPAHTVRSSPVYISITLYDCDYRVLYDSGEMEIPQESGLKFVVYYNSIGELAIKEV